MRIAGIDVAKEKVDAAILSAAQRKTFQNSGPDQQQLLAWLQDNQVDVAVMEASGGYERQWARLLHDGGIDVRIVDPKRVRHFAQAVGQLAKSDRLDAEMIAAFGEAVDPPGQAFDDDGDELQRLVSGQMQLKTLQVRIGNWNEHQAPVELREAYQALAQVLEDQIERLARAVTGKVRHTERFAERAEIIESVPGLGTGTAAGLIALLPELGLVSNKAIAALVGVAPYANQSGPRDGPRSISGGRRKVRQLLYMPTVGAATRHNPVIRAYYQRLLDNGKKPQVALIACMRKLIVILNTMIAKGEKWDPTQHTID